jgi:hypothetical protein
MQSASFIKYYQYHAKTPIGLMVNELCGLQWTPQYMFVESFSIAWLKRLTERALSPVDYASIDRYTSFIPSQELQ